jgi:phage shock protein E
MSIFGKLFSREEKPDLGELVKKGAVIIDVRTRQEYIEGHVKGSLNIPLDELRGVPKQVKTPETPVILCCASGMRSGVATRFLKGEGLKNVHNGGSWRAVKQLRGR